MRPLRRYVSSAFALLALASCSPTPSQPSRPPAIPSERSSDDGPATAPPSARHATASRRRCSPENSLAALCERWLQTKEQQRYADCGARDCEALNMAALAPAPSISFHGLSLSHGYCNGNCEPRVGVRGLPLMGEPTNGALPGCSSAQGIDYVLLVLQQGALYWPVLQVLMADGVGGGLVNASPPVVEHRDDRRLEVSFTDRGNYADDDGGAGQYARTNVYAFDFSGGRLTPLSRSSRVTADEGGGFYFPEAKDVDASCSDAEPDCTAACPF